MYKRPTLWLPADLWETAEARRQRNDAFKMLEGR